MKLNSVLFSLVSLFSLWLVLNATYVQAETVGCTVVGPLPTTIDNPGIYCLKSHRTINTPLTFAAITINANNVVLDLNGFRLRGRGAPDSHDIGILCDNCSNVTVKNGTIQGFDTGIRLGASLSPTPSVNLIEDIRAFRNTRLGIAAVGHGVFVRNNHVVETGGTTVGPEAIGINVQGTGIRVLNNDIVSVRQPNGVGRGIDIITGSGFSEPPDNLAINNRITNADEGIRYFESAGKFRDNMTSSVTIPYMGGTNASNND